MQSNNKLVISALVMLLVWMGSFANAFGQNEKESVEQFRDAPEFKMPEVVLSEGTLVLPPTSSIDNKNDRPDSMGVFYTVPSGLWRLIDRHVALNRENSEAEGFRIQIYAGSSLESANDAKADYLEAFYAEDELEVYQMWNPPHFRVRVGDFLSRNAALREVATIREIFPDAFIVSDKVKLPKYKKYSRIQQDVPGKSDDTDFNHN